MTLTELAQKDVILLPSGENLGRADDLQWDPISAQVEGLILFGRPHLFGLLGRDPDLLISWSEVENVGNDVVLVKTDPGGWKNGKRRKKWNFWAF